MPLSPVDYTADAYHKQRHPELIADAELQIAWSECAETFYFQGGVTGKTIFEFGGALGHNLIALTKANDCHMLELSEIGRANAEKFGIAAYADLGELPHLNFDIVLCRHVLEHVDSPLDTLTALKKLLAPTGHMVLVLPVERPEEGPVEREIDFHLYDWTPRNITNLLRRAGFYKTSYAFNYYNGRRICLPIRKYLGKNAYVRAVANIGKLSNAKELVIKCLP